MKRILCLTILVVLGSALVFADIPRPDPAKTPKQVKGIDTTLMIELNRDVKEAKLIIPRSQISQLRAEFERLDDGADNVAAVVASNIFSRTQTIVSGVFLSLALVFGGMWFVRSDRLIAKKGKVAGLVTILAFFGFGATLLYANVGPPPEARWINGKMFSQAVHLYKQGSGNIKLEVSDRDTGVRLIVPDPANNASPTPTE